MSCVGGVFGIFLLVATYFFVYKKRKCNQGLLIAGEAVPLAAIRKPSKGVSLQSIQKGNVTMPTEEEFEKLFTFDETVESRLTMSQGRLYNTENGFNLDQNVLPYDYNRVVLKTPIDGCNYINASWLSHSDSEDDYDSLIYTSYVPYSSVKFIVTQDPTSNTRPHYYQMLHENLIDIIVHIKNKKDAKIPKIDKDRHFGKMRRKINSRAKLNRSLSQTEMELFNTTSDVQYTHKITLFDLINWPTRELTTSEETKDLLSAICLIRKHMGVEKDSLKLVAHDGDGGVSGASVFVALYDLLQRVDESLPCDNTSNGKCSVDENTQLNVVTAVNTLRRDRASMVNNYANYKLLFMCLEHYGRNWRMLSDSAGTKSESVPAATTKEVITSEKRDKKKIKSPRNEINVDEKVIHPENIEEVYVEYNLDSKVYS